MMKANPEKKIDESSMMNAYFNSQIKKYARTFENFVILVRLL